ncbi:MAG TPA: hypothetical protein P5556_01335 [Candidatus Gastranaerophilales bacterium]|nr:hypothetical protein [Candidatus Gastranaerophilales bacterium]
MKYKQFFLILKQLADILLKKKITPAEKNEQFIKNISRNGIKDCFTGDDTLSIRGKQEFIKADINKEAYSIIKKGMENQEILFNFIESKGAIIVKSRYMDKILRFFGEKEGFITPISGYRALFFILIINMFCSVKLNIGLKTPALFALKDEPVNIYTFSHQFHLWFSYINNLPGFEEKTMQNFKNFWEAEPDALNMSYLSVDEVISLKDIISRELEAINFVKEMARELVGQKNSLKMLRDGKSINL